MGVSFEKENGSLSKRGNKSLNSLGEKKRGGTSKKFKTFDKEEKMDDAFDFLRTYSKKDNNEDEPKESTRNSPKNAVTLSRREESRGRKGEEREVMVRKSNSDNKASRNEYRSKTAENRLKRNLKMNESSDEEEEEAESVNKRGDNERRARREEEGRRKKRDNDAYSLKSEKNDYKFKSENDFKTKTFEKEIRRNDTEKKRVASTPSLDNRAKYLDIHHGSGENPLDELLKAGSHNAILQEDLKRESSGWNVSDDDMEDYLRAKNYHKRNDSDEALTKPNTSTLYWGAASLLAAGVTMAYVKNKFFS